ncbi:B-type lectin plumieribetin-like [Antennarius striatus]|uniref:B-type lectin plumieribetin-like n=1 Tax=Antennarius striatus TaxID=241820 RepID=UPI0035B21124
MSINYMSKNDELRRGDSLISNNKMFEAIFQDDGNFVIYTKGEALWASGTNASEGFRLCLQGDCNLVIIMSRNYMSKNDELRRGDSLISNNKMFEAVFQGNCNLILYNERNVARWSSVSGKLEANMCRLQLTDEGKLELYREAQRIWSSAESTGKKL